MMMKQTLVISFVGVAMLVQLTLLPTRSMLYSYFGPDRPRMSLPIASEGLRSVADCYKELSWTKAGGWVAGGIGSIKTEDLESSMRTSFERSKELRLNPRIRVRIPPDAPASVFVHFVMSAERIGVTDINVAVVQPDAPWM